jgi:hypothetical protein
MGPLVVSPPLVLPVQSRCYQVLCELKDLPDSVESRQLVTALGGCSVVLAHEVRASTLVRTWRAPAVGLLGPWLMQMSMRQGALIARLTLSDFGSLPQALVWECTDWNTPDAKLFLPIAPAEMQCRIPALRVVPS